MKKSKDKKEAELAAVLGKPKYYIDTPEADDEEEYFWFPTIGDSMTDATDRSIPGGSLVLGRWLRFDSIGDVPLHRPIVVIIHYGGDQYCLLKSACAVLDPAGHESHAESQKLCLRSYNPSPRCDDLWVPFHHVKFIFVVEKVRLPGGREFIPRQEKVKRKKKRKK
jgi:hypothetical protein